MSCGSTTCTSNKSALHRHEPVIGYGWSIPAPWTILVKIDAIHERWRQRQQLLELDDHLLNDIGVTREEAIKEARRPFWK